MTSIFDALTQLFTRWGIGLRYVQWCVAGVLGGYVGLAVLSVFLSSWGFQWLIWVFIAFYVFGVINLMASPFLWGGVAGVAYVRGQAGGQEGLSIEDGINTVQAWGITTIKGTAKFLLFYGAVPFIWTALFQTKGWEQENLVALILLPTVIYFALVRFPNSQSTFNTIGYVLMAVVLVGVLGTIYNTVNRVTVDPSVQEVQTYLNDEARNLKKDEQELAQLLINKVKKTGEDSLTSAQLGEWENLKKRAVQETPAGRVTTLATQVATDVANAKPSDPNWWQAHWYLPVLGVGVIIALAILYRLFVRTAGEPDAGAHASAETSAKKGVSLWGIACLAFLGWCAFSYATATGWPGEYIANYGYTHQTKLYLKNLSDQKVCDQGLKPGTWHVSFPREIYLAHPSQNGRYDKVGGFYLLHKGEMLRKSFLEDVWVNGVRTGWNEMVTVGPDHCFTVTVNISPEVKAEAVMYGNPQCWSEHQQSCQASGVPRTAEVNLMFSQKAPIR